MLPPPLVYTLLLITATLGRAAPSRPSSVRRRATIALSPDQVSAFEPYTHYASAAYCNPRSTSSWTCGSACDANPGFVPTASGGDDILTQYWFVGYDPALHEVIVAHQGTDIDLITPALTDVDIPLEPVDKYMFPGVAPPVMVHAGFAAAQHRSAAKVLRAIRRTMSTFNTSAVTVTGHSLGAAIALLDAILIPLHIPNTTVRYIGYGLPRVGNLAFANYVDSQPISVTHINNQEDPIPVLPPMALGFHHPSGEVHIQRSGEWVACPGQDNPSSNCSVGDVSFMQFNEANHRGPYGGIEMAC
ncbi:lipase [Trametes polyzona]|nr:lipase [Trametes polyzona]